MESYAVVLLKQTRLGPVASLQYNYCPQNNSTGNYTTLRVQIVLGRQGWHDANPG